MCGQGVVLCLGGGPSRAHPGVTNLNIASHSRPDAYVVSRRLMCWWKREQRTGLMLGRSGACRAVGPRPATEQQACRPAKNPDGLVTLSHKWRGPVTFYSVVGGLHAAQLQRLYPYKASSTTRKRLLRIPNLSTVYLLS